MYSSSFDFDVITGPAQPRDTRDESAGQRDNQQTERAGTQPADHGRKP